MRITCPQCGFFRELPDNKVPVTSTLATCPKCRHRFKFRHDAFDLATPAPRASGQPAGGEAATSSWRRHGPDPAPLDRKAPPTAGPVPGTEPEAPPVPAPGPTAPPPVEFVPLPGEVPEEPGFEAPPREPDPAPTRKNDAASQDWRAAAPVPAPAAEAAPRPAETPHDFREAVRSERHPREQAPAQERGAPLPDAPATANAATPPSDTPRAVRPSPAETAPPAGPDPAGDHGPTIHSDGVRDIWARLQAMDEEPAPGRNADRHEPAGEDARDDTREAPRDDGRDREPITDPIPWERQDAYGFLPGLFLTLRKILLTPLDFFGAMPEGRPKGKALVFNLLISEFLLVLDFLWSIMGLRGKFGDPGHTDAMAAFSGSPSLSFLLALLLVPVVLSIGIYLDAWITHLLLLLFRNASKGFNETFRILCYSAAPTVLSAVPVAGQILSPVILIWYMALQAIGLKRAHQGGYTQTLAAIFIKWSLYLFILLAMLQNFTPGR